jgi:putative phage-type endonuclease
MGVSPYKTRYGLWLDKLGRSPEEPTPWAAERGNLLEPMARADYELMYGVEAPPILAVHKDYPWLRASLDGYHEGTVLEIKCPSAADHAAALAGQVPEKYFWQCQHQLFVTGAERVHYYSFDGRKGALVELKRNYDAMDRLFTELSSFWDLVLKQIPPAKVKEDFKPLRFKGAAQLERDYLAGLVTVEEILAKVPDNHRIGSIGVDGSKIIRCS